MAEAGGGASGGGVRLPATFGEKLSFMAPAVAVTLLVAVLIAFVLVWVVSGNLNEKITDLRNTFEQKEQALNRRVTEEEKETKRMTAEVERLNTTTAELIKDKDQLKKDLGETVDKLGKAQDVLAKTSTTLTDFIETKNKVDAEQRQDITKVSNKVQYIEDKIKILDSLESDVKALKVDTGDLKGKFVVLKGDLQKVREKGEITEQELGDLTDRTRLFQLRVLAARAKEAADAARMGDVKSLLARLNE